MKLYRHIERLLKFADVALVMLVDPDRELVHAAKEWVRLRRERCDKRCDICDEVIENARARCARWRELQGVKMVFDFGFVAVLATTINKESAHVG